MDKIEIGLGVYPPEKRRAKRSLKQEVKVLACEVAQLQYRHNQLVKALLALANGHKIQSEVVLGRNAVTSDSEATFIYRCFGVDSDDLLDSDVLHTDEEEILALLNDN